VGVLTRPGVEDFDLAAGVQVTSNDLLLQQGTLSGTAQSSAKSYERNDDYECTIAVYPGVRAAWYGRVRTQPRDS